MDTNNNLTNKNYKKMCSGMINFNMKNLSPLNSVTQCVEYNTTDRIIIVSSV